MLRAEVLLEILLSATLVGTQALVVNRLGLPFAAVTLFAGLGAYAVAAGTVAGWAHSALITSLVVLLMWLFVSLRNALPRDRYLLVTLAALALAETVAGGLRRYGGQIGAPALWSSLPTYQATAFLPYAVLCFTVVFVMLFMLERTELGLTVEVTRLAIADRQLSSLVPVARVTWLVLGSAMSIAVCAGMLMALYSGRASPEGFGLTRAISFLLATVLAGRRAWVAALVSMAFFAFPFVFSSAFGYQLQSMGYVRELLTGALVLIFGERMIQSDRGLARTTAVE